MSPMNSTTASRLLPRLCFSTLLLAGLWGCENPSSRGVANAGGTEEFTTQQAATTCGAGPTVPGIDVSSWQGNIDWNAVAGAGYKFAITRFSDGYYHDTKFAQNWQGIKSVGMIRGVYQYFEPNEDPVTQANQLLDAIGALGPGDLPVMLDVETPSNNPSPAVYRQRIHQWVDRITQATGRAPMIYTGHYYWPQYVGTSEFSDLPLVHAQYTSAACPNIPDAWSSWVMWQYSSTGSVPGIAGNVDMDRFNGTLEQLQALAQSNRAPRGWLDAANCDAVSGWAQDEDSPDATVAVHIYVGGPAGDPNAVGYAISAATPRGDLCAAIGSCNHGYAWDAPNGFKDGTARPVYAYGIDAQGGINALLAGSPQTLHCDAPTPPVVPVSGVKRHVPSPDVMAAWAFDWHNIAILPDATLDTYADGPAVTASPTLVAVNGDPAVYLQEYSTLRHVPNPDAMTAWHFAFDAVQPVTSAQLGAQLMGAPLLGEPFLARGSGNAVYVVDAPPPLWALAQAAALPTSLESGHTASVTWTLKNRGALTWGVGQVFLVPVNPSNVDGALCDASWMGCQKVVGVSSETAPGAVGTFSFTVRAPQVASATSVTQCFGLQVGTHFFFEAGQGGPLENALCATVQVTPSAVETPDAGVSVTSGNNPGASSGSADAGVPGGGSSTSRPTGSSSAAAGTSTVVTTGSSGTGGSTSAQATSERPMEQPQPDPIPADSTVCDCARLPSTGGAAWGMWMALGVVLVRGLRRRG